MSGGQPTFEVDDLVVLLLGGPTGPGPVTGRIDGITRLEKLVFIAERETSLGELLTESPDFKAHNFGPFSKRVYQAVEMLAAAGLVRDSSLVSSTAEDAWETQELIGVEFSRPYATRTFELTEKGRRYYEALVEELPAGTEELLQQFKQTFASIPLRQLVRYVYRRYPAWTEKSVIRDEVLGSG